MNYRTTLKVACTAVNLSARIKNSFFNQKIMNIGFTQAESDELRKYQTIGIVIKNNPISVVKSLMFKAKTVTFLENLQKIEDEIANKNIDTSGFTENKNTLKEIVAIFYDPICAYAEEFAVENKHTDLAKNVNYTESKIFHLKDGSVFGIVTAINAAITPFIEDVKFVPYGVTAPILLEGLHKATTFRDYLSTNFEAKHEKTVAGDAVENLLKPLRDNVDSFNRLIKWFKLNDEEFYNLYIVANKLIHTGNRITKIGGFIYKKGTEIGIPKATFKNIETGLTATADLLGTYLMEKFKSGLFNFEIAAPGFISKQQIIKVSPGTAYEFNFELDPVV